MKHAEHRGAMNDAKHSRRRHRETLLAASLALPLSVSLAFPLRAEDRQSVLSGAILAESQPIDERGLSTLVPFRRRTPTGFLYPWPLLPQPPELLGYGLIGNRGHRAGQAEAAQTAQRQLGTHFHQQLELDRLAFLELEIPY